MTSKEKTLTEGGGLRAGRIMSQFEGWKVTLVISLAPLVRWSVAAKQLLQRTINAFGLPWS